MSTKWISALNMFANLKTDAMVATPHSVRVHTVAIAYLSEGLKCALGDLRQGSQAGTAGFCPQAEGRNRAMRVLCPLTVPASFGATGCGQAGTDARPSHEEREFRGKKGEHKAPALVSVRGGTCSSFTAWPDRGREPSMIGSAAAVLPGLLP